MTVNYNALVRGLEWAFGEARLVKQEMTLSHGFSRDGWPVVSIYPANIHIEIHPEPCVNSLTPCAIFLGDGSTDNDQELTVAGMTNYSILARLRASEAEYQDTADVIMTILAFCIAYEAKQTLSEVIKNSSVDCPF